MILNICIVHWGQYNVVFWRYNTISGSSTAALRTVFTRYFNKMFYENYWSDTNCLFIERMNFAVDTNQCIVKTVRSWLTKNCPTWFGKKNSNAHRYNHWGNRNVVFRVHGSRQFGRRHVVNTVPKWTVQSTCDRMVISPKWGIKHGKLVCMRRATVPGISIIRKGNWNEQYRKFELKRRVEILVKLTEELHSLTLSISRVENVSAYNSALRISSAQ